MEVAAQEPSQKFQVQGETAISDFLLGLWAAKDEHWGWWSWWWVGEGGCLAEHLSETLGMLKAG